MKTKLIITEAQYNRLKANLIKETSFSWDGTYANEDDLHETDAEDYNQEYNVASTTNKNDPNYTDPYEIKEKSTMFLGNDMETIEETEELEEECGCALNQPEPTDVKGSQWFSDVDGERIIDNQVD
tara:strand:+ start:15005 stop:15382 length:378 start_codon:yes stop_codon:yes gene_type:complete